MPLVPARALTRRSFLHATGAGVVIVALPACMGDGEPDPDLPDLGEAPDLRPPRDLAPPPDLTLTCDDFLNTKRLPSKFALNTATLFIADDVFVCRDAGGLFSVSSICTHNGCTVEFLANNKRFHCPCHGSEFSYLGDVAVGPAKAPLEHYAMCLRSDGTVAVDARVAVAKGVRLKA